MGPEGIFTPGSLRSPVLLTRLLTETVAGRQQTVDHKTHDRN